MKGQVPCHYKVLERYRGFEIIIILGLTNIDYSFYNVAFTKKKKNVIKNK